MLTKKIILIVVTVVILALGGMGAISTTKSTRRTDFIMGCATGATIMADSFRVPMRYVEIINGCKKIYDTRKIEIDVDLDKTVKEGL